MSTIDEALREIAFGLIETDPVDVGAIWIAVTETMRMDPDIITDPAVTMDGDDVSVSWSIRLPAYCETCHAGEVIGRGFADGLAGEGGANA